jgi:DNA-binding cell septation regulator SpoVG
LLRYIEPPVTEIGLSEGTKGIIFDMPVKRKGDDDDDDDIVVQNVQPAQITDASYETIEEDEEQEE